MFYLPIFVNQQRMHVLKMQENSQDQLFHSFVMCSMHDYEMISFPSDEAQLICDCGDNQDLRDMDFILEKLDSSPYAEKYPSMPCYRLSIIPGNGEKKNNSVDKMYLDGHIDSDFASLDYLRVTVDSRLRDVEYILEVRYEHHAEHHGKKEVINYYSGIRVFTYKDEYREVCTASLDFGSEASQVKFKGDEEDSVNLREAFCELAEYDKSAAYWQGRPNDDKEHLTLYKSIYHIHTKPGKTFFGDLPMNNKERTFIQSLLPIGHTNFDDLVLLPNLKLIELLSYQVHSTDIDFSSPENTNLINRQRDSLGSRELRQSVLRQILCNFLAVIMYRKRQNGVHNLCLRFTLLVPNVYYQNKVATIINGLYEDFDLLCKNHPDRFGCYRGIEVQTVSESDASYFGLRLEQKSGIKDEFGAYSLIIDAGKGTTDFSLLHQTGQELSHYESIYRSGIPASGHVLTYAFYEALRDYFTSIDKREVFEQIIRSAFATRQTRNLLAFVAELEEQKKNYGKFKSQDNDEDSEARSMTNQLVNMENLIKYVHLLNTKRISIIGVKDKVNEKVEKMVALLETSIIQYAKEHQLTLLQVYLSGRAFRFEPFREAVINKLIENKLIETKSQVEFNDISAKNACLKGGIADRAYTINRKSAMLSVPTISENVGETSNLRKKIRHLFMRDKPVIANVDFNFFYKGLKKGNVTNVNIDICGRITQQSFPTSQDVFLYFVGDGYLLKAGNRSELLEEDAKYYQCDREILEQLMRESLFPFDIESMGYSRSEKNMSINQNSESDVTQPAGLTVPAKPTESKTRTINDVYSGSQKDIDD